MTRSRFGISSKLFCVCAAFSLPIVVMFVLMTRAQLGKIEFADKEVIGDEVQRPLQRVLEHVSRHRRLALRLEAGDGSVAHEIAVEADNVARAIDQVAAAQARHGETLQLTPDGLKRHHREGFDAAGLRQKWTELQAEPGAAGYVVLVLHVRTMITHVGDTSNLILDPDLDTYYLMDVTLLALPQMEDRVQQIAADVEAIAVKGPPSESERRRLVTHAAFLREADWGRIAASTETAITEDPNFHGVSSTLAPTLKPHVARCAQATERVVRRLESDAPLDLVAFRSEIDALERALHEFHRDALDEEDVLLGGRIAELERQLHMGMVLAALALVISVLLAFKVASNLARHTKRIARATEAFAKGDLGARVGGSGLDESSASWPSRSMPWLRASAR